MGRRAAPADEVDNYMAARRRSQRQRGRVESDDEDSSSSGEYDNGAAQVTHARNTRFDEEASLSAEGVLDLSSSSSSGSGSGSSGSSGSASEGEEDEDKHNKGGWGTQKRVYYGESDEELDSEDAAKLEEDEGMKMQQRRAAQMDEEDFGVTVLRRRQGAEPKQRKGSATEEPTNSSSSKAAKKKKSSKSEQQKKGGAGVDLDGLDLTHGDSSVVVETLDKGGKKAAGGRLSKAQKLKIIERDAPELLALLKEFKATINEVQSQVKPALDRVQNNQLATKEGLSYLDLKYMLLLNYCVNICFYLLLRAHGESVKDHPVLDQLLEARTTIEKMRPIDHKMRYQVDKLLKMAAVAQEQQQQQHEAGKKKSKKNKNKQKGGEDEEDDDMMDVDGVNARPRLGNLVAKGDDEDSDSDSQEGLYRPPRMVSMEYEDNEKEARKKRKATSKVVERAGKSSVLRELRNEFSEMPEEVVPFTAGDARALDKLQRDDEERQAYEEDFMIRKVLSKKEQRKRNTVLEKKIDMFADFDDFNDLVVPDKADAGQKSNLLAQLRDKTSGKRKAATGDDDLPRREPQQKRSNRHVPDDNERGHFGGFDDNEEIDSDEAMPAGDDNDFYRKHAAKSKAKQAARGSKASKRVTEYLVAPDEDEDGTAKRTIGRDIEKNKGLMKWRNKLQRNPRVKKREQFRKAKLKQKSTTRSVPEGTKVGGYQGELTGIRKNLTRAVKM